MLFRLLIDSAVPCREFAPNLDATVQKLSSVRSVIKIIMNCVRSTCTSFRLVLILRIHPIRRHLNYCIRLFPAADAVAAP